MVRVTISDAQVAAMEAFASQVRTLITPRTPGSSMDRSDYLLWIARDCPEQVDAWLSNHADDAAVASMFLLLARYDRPSELRALIDRFPSPPLTIPAVDAALEEAVVHGRVNTVMRYVFLPCTAWPSTRGWEAAVREAAARRHTDMLRALAGLRHQCILPPAYGAMAAAPTEEVDIMNALLHTVRHNDDASLGVLLSHTPAMWKTPTKRQFKTLLAESVALFGRRADNACQVMLEGHQ